MPKNIAVKSARACRLLPLALLALAGVLSQHVAHGGPLRDVAYGSDAAQRMDVYLPNTTGAAAGLSPVILMVHGGAWRIGDKAVATVVDNKVARWVAKGFVLVSINYRMQRGTTPLVQAGDVAAAVAAVQGKASSWGADAGKLGLMGHSAGAHLVALLGANPAQAARQGAKPWLGTISLDSAALDIEALMAGRHLGLYDEPFGSDPALWRAASPQAQLVASAPPLLLVCSSARRDSCPASEKFKARADSLGVRAQVLPQNLSHRDINHNLGLVSASDAAYTQAVEAFIGSLDPALAQRFAAH